VKSDKSQSDFRQWKQNFLPLKNFQTSPCGPPSLLFNEHRGCFPAKKKKKQRPEHEASHLPSSSSEVKRELELLIPPLPHAPSWYKLRLQFFNVIVSYSQKRAPCASSPCSYVIRHNVSSCLSLSLPATDKLITTLLPSILTYVLPSMERSIQSPNVPADLTCSCSNK